jgi:hypothetical protein
MDAQAQYDSPYDTGVGFRIRTKFIRGTGGTLTLSTRCSQVASAGNTNWSGSDDTNYRIVRIDKEVVA